MHPSLHDLHRELIELGHLTGISSLLSWDQEVMMPVGSLDARSAQSALLSKIQHNQHTGKRFKSVLAECINLETGECLIPDLTAQEEKMVLLVYDDWKKATRLPSSFVEDYAFLISQSQHIWAQAREKSNFDAFAPTLEKVIEKSKEKANLLGYEDSPYDGLMDEFEPGVTTKDITPLFTQLREDTVALLHDIMSTQVEPFNLQAQRYNPDKQWSFSLEILREMGYDFERGRLDKSVHPFTIHFHPSDVRITTRINQHDLMEAFLSTVHEGGHALYEQGLEADWFGTPLGESTSLGIHESQSRLWENLVSKSYLFWEGHYHKLQALFPTLNEVSLDDFYRAINHVTPSLIRVDSDELTYNLHIMIRYEIEQAIFNGDATVQDLPALWNSLYEEYLGIVPPNDAEGILQDVHWSCGLFGYFPTYTLGNIYSCQFFEQAKKDLPRLESNLKSGNLMPLRKWLQTNIHCHGRGKSAKELVEEICGTGISTAPLLAYWRTKFCTS